MKKTFFIVLAVGCWLLAVGFSSAYNPSPQETESLKQLMAVSQLIYQQSPAKAQKLLISAWQAKNQFINDPKLFYLLGQREVYLANLFAYDQQNPSYTLTTIQQHNKRSDCRILIEKQVYDITNFLAKYEAFSSLRERCGSDKSSFFNAGWAEAQALRNSLEKYLIGVLK